MNTSRNTPRPALGFVQTAFLCSVLAGGASALAHDDEAGKKKAEEVCSTCHGAAGNKPLPGTPRLAGQHDDYLRQALEAYRKGSRQNPIMSAMAQPLTDRDIRDLARYFSRQQGLVDKY